MTKRYIRNIAGDIYDYELDKFYHEDYEGKPIEYEDDVVKQLNKQDQQIKKTKEVLQKHYDYAYTQRQKNLDNAIVAEAYNVLRVTVADIADELGIEIKK